MTDKIELSDAMLRSLKLPATGVIYHPDSKIAGFGIRVSKHGLKTFYFIYRFKDQRPRLTLGHYPKISLAQARKRASEATGLLYRGLDPAIHLRLNEEDTHASADVTPHVSQAPIFTYALQEYIDKHLATKCRPSTQREVSRSLRSNFLQSWAAIPIDQITAFQVSEIIDAKIADDKPSAAIHAHADIKAFFAWCVARKMIKASPADTIPTPAAKGKRKRSLNAHEIQAVWLATEKEVNPIGKLVQLALVTGQRRGEIAGMRWDELHIKHGYWEIPGSRTKNGLDHIVPLSFLAIAIIDSVTKTPMPMQPGDTEIRFSPFVFPAQRLPAKPISDFSDTKERLDRLAAIAPWCIHDLRRTMATGLGEIGILPKPKKKLFNHAENEVHDTYDRFEYFKERCEAMHLWALYVKKAIAGQIETASIGAFDNPFARIEEQPSPSTSP